MVDRDKERRERWNEGMMGRKERRQWGEKGGSRSESNRESNTGAFHKVLDTRNPT